MRKLLMVALAAVVVLAVMDVALAQGKGGGGKGGGCGPGGNPGGGMGPGPAPQPDPKADPPKGDPAGGANQPGDPPKHGDPGEKGEVDPGVVRLVRTLRKLVHEMRMLKEKGADEKDIEAVEAKIRKIIEMLEKHDIKWREMNNHEKCCMDPEVGKLIRALEWLRNELKGLDPEKDKKKIQKIEKKMKQVMQALRKMFVGDDDLPEGLKEKKHEGDGHKEAENGKCKGDCERERKRDGSCGDCDGCKKGGDCERKKDGSCDGCKGDGSDGCCPPKGDGGGDGAKGDGGCAPKGDGSGGGCGGCGGCGGKSK